MQRIPAALAACTPLTASSTTTHWLGARPNRAAAPRKISGAGFLAFTVSPVTTQSQVSGGRPIWLKLAAILTWSALEATAEEQETFDAAHDSMRGGWGGTFERLTAYLAAAK